MASRSEFRLTRQGAERRIRATAADSFNVTLTNHAKERMAEREIVWRDIERTLKDGVVFDEPEPAREGEWKCKIVLAIRGRRDLGVVVVLRPNGGLWVKTVEWEDPK